jgi:hypothetical protein
VNGLTIDECSASTTALSHATVAARSTVRLNSNGLTNLANNNFDFARVQGVMRYAPV